jgi:hypothetical protein
MRRYTMGKYTPLVEYLGKQTTSEVRLSFAEIEEIIGDALPASAHNHRPWWSNQQAHPSHPWATEWLEAGWECDGLSLNDQWVRFRRVG